MSGSVEKTIRELWTINGHYVTGDIPQFVMNIRVVSGSPDTCQSIVKSRCMSGNASQNNYSAHLCSNGCTVCTMCTVNVCD